MAHTKRLKPPWQIAVAKSTGCQIDFVDNGLDAIAAGAKEKFQAARMNGFVEKPINRELLFKTIEEHTGSPLTRPDFG